MLSKLDLVSFWKSSWYFLLIVPVVFWFAIQTVFSVFVKKSHPSWVTRVARPVNRFERCRSWTL